MLEHLDMGTMLAVGAMICLPLAGMMVYYSFARKTYPGFHLWTLGVLCVGTGAMLVALRRYLPAFVSIVLANILVAAMPYFLMRGMAVFLGVQWRHRVLDAAVFVFLTAVLIWGAYVRPDLSLRIEALSAVQFLFFGETLYLVLRHFSATMGKSNGFLTLSILFTLLASSSRLAITLATPSLGEFLRNSGAAQSATVLLTILGIVGIIAALLTVNSHRMENDLKKAMDKVESLADRDGLTDIFNRRYFDQALDREFRRLQRNGRPLSLIMGDIDCFKNYNDTYGHQAGDDCIRAVARTFRDSARRVSDVAARYGGEEFVMLLPETGVEGAEKIAADIARALDEQAIPHASSPVHRNVTLSLGVATVVPTATNSPDRLVALADKALYAGKERGRNRIQVRLPDDGA